MKFLKIVLSLLAIVFSPEVIAQNQTATTSPILPGSELPFEIQIKKESFQLPFGLQSYVVGQYKGKWLLITGRLNGLHGFNNDPNNFPPNQQNHYVVVLDFENQKIFYRSLTDPKSGLSQEQIDSLSVTAAQGYQSGQTLYVTGGYGFQNSTGQFITWPLLTALDLPGLIHWVTHPDSHKEAVKSIRQVSNPLLAVTGGAMDKIGKKKRDPVLLIFGQDYEGTYFFGNPVQRYTEQVRKLLIKDNGKKLAVKFIDTDPILQNPNYRRRDLNIVRVIRPHHKKLRVGLVALSGVFTLTDGVWTVPVEISKDGSAVMKDPNDSTTFKQSLNNYNCANIGLFSKRTGEMYTLLFGGITFEYIVNGVPQTDTEFPFTNQIAVIKLDPEGHFSQYLLDSQYPVVPSEGSNPGNPLLFGASCQFFYAKGVSLQTLDVLKLDRIHKKTTIGYIVGGIQSTVPNTSTTSDSAASPYIFRVQLIPKDCSSH